MRKQLITVFWLTFLLLLPAASELAGQTQGRARVRGVVTDEETGEPISGVAVRLYSVLAGQYHSTSPKTGKEGEWKAFYLRSGMWNIEFDKPGYETKKITARVVAESGAKIPLLETTMRPIKGIKVSAGIVEEFGKGNALFDEGKFLEARQFFEGLLEKYPDVFIIYTSLGNCEFSMENYEAALEMFMRVYREMPESEDIINRIAGTYNNWGRMEEALEWYRKIPLDGIKDIVTAYNTGILFYNNGKAEESLPYFRKAIDIDSEFGDGFYQLGLAYTALGKNPEAVQALIRFLELAPDSPNAGTAKAIIEALSKGRP